MGLWQRFLAKKTKQPHILLVDMCLISWNNASGKDLSFRIQLNMHSWEKAPDSPPALAMSLGKSKRSWCRARLTGCLQGKRAQAWGHVLGRWQRTTWDVTWDMLHPWRLFLCWDEPVLQSRCSVHCIMLVNNTKHGEGIEKGDNPLSCPVSCVLPY